MTFISNEICPGCDAAEISLVNNFRVSQKGNGVLPDGYTMWSCNVCGLWFKDQRADSESLKLYYDGLTLENDQWNYEVRLPHEKKVDRILSRLPLGAKVLDVGCWTGRLLAMHERVDRYGIEPNKKAAAVAERNGIKIIGEVVSPEVGKDILFDLITIIDVFEHLDKPVTVLEELIQKLKPGGKLIIVTGRTDCFPVRLAESTYWYFSVVPDHIVFLNATFFNWARKAFPVKSISEERLRHYHFSIQKFLWELSWLLIWRFLNPNSPFNKGMWAKILPSTRFRNWVDIPICNSFKDHYYVTILK